MASHLSTIFLAYFISGSLHGILSWAEPLQGPVVTRVEKGLYRSVVSIAQKKDKHFEESTHICTGVLIKKKFILTAAHCLAGKSPADFRIIAGSNDLREGKKYDIDMWITYNQWAKSKNITEKQVNSNDIALIKCACRIYHILPTPAVISFVKENYLIDEDVVLVGWGMTNTSPLIPSRYLNEGRARVLSNTECEMTAYQYFKKKVYVSDKIFCSKGKSSLSVAHGDSGGPVFSGNSVVGINMGLCPANGTCDAPLDVLNKHKLNIHTLVGPYSDFIFDVLNNY